MASYRPSQLSCVPAACPPFEPDLGLRPTFQSRRTHKGPLRPRRGRPTWWCKHCSQKQSARLCPRETQSRESTEQMGMGWEGIPGDSRASLDYRMAHPPP